MMELKKEKKDVYLQIIDQIKLYIKLGIYKKDEPLPSCRKLALELKVNPNTVNKAYLELEKENLVYSIVKKGYFIKENDKQDDENRKTNLIRTELNYLKNKKCTKNEILKVIEEIFEKEEKDEA